MVLDNVRLLKKHFTNAYDCLHRVLCFKPSFFVLCAAMVIMGKGRDFFIIFVSVFCHELSHVLTARIFGLKAERILIYPIGHAAVLKDIYNISIIKRMFIYFSGPLVNFFIFLSCIFTKGSAFHKIAEVNIMIAIFNLLPIYPLDGGRIVCDILAYIYGMLKSIRISQIVNYALNSVLFLLSIVQIALYPFNISILCISIYIYKINKVQKNMRIYEFYKMIFTKVYNKRKKRIIKADIKKGLNNIVAKLGIDYDAKIELYLGKCFIARLEEEEFLKLFFTDNG